MKPSALLTTFVGLAFALLAATPASAAVSVIDTSAPHYRANPIVLSVSATADPAWNYVEEITDARGGLYTRGADGIYSFRLNAYSPALGTYSANEEVLAAGGSHPQSVSSVSVAYVNALAPGSWNLYLEVASFGWVDGHWESRGYYDEEGNWVEEDDEWRPPESGGAGAFQTWLPLTISNGGSTPQTITWTSSPPSILPFTQTTPITLAATCTTGAPVRFSLGPTSGYPYAFALAGNTLTYSGMVGTSGWIGNAWTVLAEAPASATHAYASTLYSITLDRGTQIMPTPITGPTISHTGSQGLWPLMAPAVSAAGGSSMIDYQLIGGGGTLTAGTYYPNGYVGPVSIRTRYPGNDLFYPSNDGVITFATAVPTVVPAITSHPAGTSAWVGGTVNLAVAASGAPTPTYQWRKNGADLAGATAATLILANVQVADSGTYVAVASNSVGTAQSDPATVTISNPPPTIATQPASRTTYAGEAVALFATGAGSPTPSYQWRKDGVAIAGATSATLAFANPQATDAGSYTLVVSNPHGSATSQPATLTINPARPPTITSSATVTGSVGTPFAYTFSTTVPATSFVWDEGVLPSGITPIGNGSLLQGTPTEAVTRVLKFRPWGAAGIGPQFTLTIVVTTGSGQTVPNIDTHPVSQTVNAGENVLFSVVASGTGSLSYQWYRDGVPLAFQRMSSLLLGAVGPADVGNYTVRISNAAGSVTANAVSLTVAGVAPSAPPSNGSLPVITSQPQSAAVPAGQDATFGVIATSATPLAYQWLRNGLVIDGATNDTFTLQQIGFGNNGDVHTVLVSNVAGSVASAEAQLLVTSPVLAVSQLNANSFRLTWSAEKFGGYPVTYRVIVPGVLDAANATQPLVVSGLSAATTYSALVQAIDFTGKVFRAVPLRIRTPEASGVTSQAAKSRAPAARTLATSTPERPVRSLTTAASPPAPVPSRWLDVQKRQYWEPTPQPPDGLLDEVFELDDPGRNSIFNITSLTIESIFVYEGQNYGSPFSLHWELQPSDYFSPSFFSQVWDENGEYIGPVGIGEFPPEQNFESEIIVLTDFFFSGSAEFDALPGFEYHVFSYSPADPLSKDAPSRWKLEGWTGWAGPTRRQFIFSDIEPPNVRQYQLVKYNLAPGGCILHVPGMGGTGAAGRGPVSVVRGPSGSPTGLIGTIKLPNGTEITGSTDGTTSTISVTTTTSAGTATGKVVFDQNGVQVESTLAGSIGVSNGPGSITLGGGVTATIGGNGVSVSGTAGASIGIRVEGLERKIELALPPGLGALRELIGQAISTIGSVFGLDGDPNKTKVNKGDGVWRDPDDPALGDVSETGQTVQVGRTDADGRIPKPENTISIVIRVEPSAPNETPALRSRDRFLTGSFDASSDRIRTGLVEFITATGQVLGTYKLDGSTGTHIYDSQEEILSDGELDAVLAGQYTASSPRINQQVVFWRSSPGSSTIRFSTVFPEVGNIKIRLTPNSGEPSERRHTLTAEPNFGGLLVTLSERIRTLEMPAVASWSLAPEEEGPLDDDDYSAVAAASTQPRRIAALSFSGDQTSPGGAHASSWAVWSNNFVAKAATAADAAVSHAEANPGLAFKIGGGFIKGFVDGAWDGLKGDAEGIAELGKMGWEGLTGDFHRVKAIWDGIGHILNEAIIGRGGQIFDQMVAKVVDSAQGAVPWNNLGSTSDQWGVGAYMVGYSCGFITEQVVVISVGGGLITKAGQAVKVSLTGTKLGQITGTMVGAARKFTSGAFLAASQRVSSFGAETVRALRKALEGMAKVTVEVNVLGIGRASTVAEQVGALVNRLGPSGVSWQMIAEHAYAVCATTEEVLSVGVTIQQRLARLELALGSGFSRSGVQGFMELWGAPFRGFANKPLGRYLFDGFINTGRLDAASMGRLLEAVDKAVLQGVQVGDLAAVWRLHPFDRGRVIEVIASRGKNNLLPSNFPTIDTFLNGVANSIKSIDLASQTYQDISKLTSVLDKYVDNVASYLGQPTPWAGRTIRASEITSREVTLAIPSTATTPQLSAIQAAANRAANLANVRAAQGLLPPPFNVLITIKRIP